MCGGRVCVAGRVCVSGVSSCFIGCVAVLGSVCVAGVYVVFCTGDRRIINLFNPHPHPAAARPKIENTEYIYIHIIQNI